MLKVLRKLFGGVVNEHNYAEFERELLKRYVTKSDYQAKEQEAQAAAARAAELRDKAAASDEIAAELTAAKAQATKLNDELAQAKAAYEQGLLAARVDCAVECALFTAGAKNRAAAKALLDITEPAFDGDVLLGLDEQITALKQNPETAFLFERQSFGEAADWIGFIPQAAGDLPEDGPQGGFRLRLQRAQGNLEAIRVKQEAAAKGVYL